ncbi:MAG: type II toxin-antitoxin system VapC family toxin [Acidobacteria bacterium]|nr:type II toxin-antitoxin system VapC family toxin [Acidobacteriota bacterium]
MSGLNVVDSSGWLEYLKGSDRADLFAPAAEDQASLIVPIITVYEVYKKFRRERTERDAQEAIGTMMNGKVVNLDLSLAIDAAKLNLPLADSIIYATAQYHQATLWTQDEDFEGLPGVRYFPKV